MSVSILIDNILKYYQNLENESTGEIKYYCHTEFDSNVTEFEGLSNSNKIILKTKLSVNFISGLMKIFQAIYDDNYYFFEDENILYEIYDDLEMTCDYNVINELMSYNNVDAWIELLQLYFQNSIDEETNHVFALEIYDEIPKFTNSYYKSKKKQKIFTIQKIKNNKK